MNRAFQLSVPKQRIEWMWRSNDDPWSATEDADWCAYSDVETEIIEEAYKKKLPEALLDDYHINFQGLLQISNTNERNQRRVRRVTLEGTEEKLRQERFLADFIMPSKPFYGYPSNTIDFIEATSEHFNLFLLDADEISRLMVAKAAEGLIIEGKLVDKQREGEWMAEQLLYFEEDSFQIIAQCCAWLYCKESFLYKKLNEIMRLGGDEEHADLFRSKVPTFGPFAYLLRNLELSQRLQESTVYRGANLSDALIEQWQKEKNNARGYARQLIVFTSTSRSREKAEFMSGNVVFIFDINEAFDGFDISSFSRFNEEEFLLDPGTLFHIISCQFDTDKKKWFIHLVSSMLILLPISQPNENLDQSKHS